jgi:hypothetical protein
MSALQMYMLVVYISHISANALTGTEVFCIGLGGAGVFSSNPMSMLMPSMTSARYSDHILLAGYVALLRFFVLIQLEVVRGKRTSAPWPTLVVGAAFFCAYAMVDSVANFDRAQLIYECETEIEAVLPSEVLAIQFHLADFAIAGLWLVLAIVQRRKYAPKRMSLFLVAVLATSRRLDLHRFCAFRGISFGSRCSRKWSPQQCT